MMETEKISETLVFSSTLTRLIARGNFSSWRVLPSGMWSRVVWQNLTQALTLFSLSACSSILMIETVRSPETSINFYQIIQCHITDGGILHYHNNATRFHITSAVFKLCWCLRDTNDFERANVCRRSFELMFTAPMWKHRNVKFLQGNGVVQTRHHTCNQMSRINGLSPERREKRNGQKKEKLVPHLKVSLWWIYLRFFRYPDTAAPDDRIIDERWIEGSGRGLI
jgi:hypothetical protein